MKSKIRFKDKNEQDYPEWEDRYIGDILKIKHGRNQKEIETKGGQFPILATGGQIGRTDTPLWSKPSVLIGRKGTINKPQYMDTPFWTVDTLFYSDIYDGNSAKYIYYLFSTINWMFYNEASGVPSLNAGTIESIEIKMPCLEEQQKIADFLSTFDQKIENQQEQISILEDMKKGVMQKIFSQEIRFKRENGGDYPEWEEVLLHELSEMITKGTTPPAFSSESGINFIKIESLTGRGIDNSKCMFISEELHTTELKRSILQKNDILFSIAGSLGKHGIVKKENLPANTNQALSIIRLKAKMNYQYILEFLGSVDVANYIISCKSVGAQPNLSLEQMRNMVIKLPCDNEQQKIADFLSAFDEKIEVEKQILTILKDMKKGFLQQMFV